MQVDLGEKDEAGASRARQIIAGIGRDYQPENLVGREIIVAANLEPRQLMGLESQGMLLAASTENGLVILTPEKEVPSGSSAG